MRLQIRSLGNGRTIVLTAVLLLLLTPVGASASLLDGDWTLQTLMDEVVELLSGGEAPPEGETEDATAGADPNGEPESTDGTGG